MALVVETGAGLADAESYDSVAGILATLTKTGEETAFAALSSTAQEQVARRATRMMDGEYQFRGRKKSAAQALEWPRTAAYDDDGYLYDSLSVPKKLKEALAQFCAEGNIDLQPDQTAPGTIASESVSIAGVISESISYSSPKSQSVFYRKVDALLSELTESAQMLERA